MANQAIEYLREAWDTLFSGKENKKKKTEAQDAIDKILSESGRDKVPERPSLPDVPKYERAEYAPPTDEEVTRRAEAELTDYKTAGEKGVEEKIRALAEQYAADEKSAEEKYAAAMQKTANEYDSAKRSTDADLLKRGLARSSIAANKIAALDAGAASAKAALTADYAQKADDLARKISELGVKRQEALDDFNIAYAAKLTARIDQLKEERAELADKALRYNNSLTEKEHAAAVEKTMKESDLYSEQLAQQQKESQLAAPSAADYEKIYTAVVAELRAINKNDAREIVLNNKTLRARVGDALYYRLYDEFCR